MTTRSRRPKRHAGGKTHPDASILLAYLRGQQLEPQWRVREHVEQEHCPLCVQKLSELEQVTTVLQSLGALHAERDDPASSVAQTYARIESLAQQRAAERSGMPAGTYRQRPRTSAVRLIGVPVAFGLAILLTMVVLVFTNLSDRTFNPFSFNGHASSVPSILTVVVPAQSAPTQHPNVKATVADTPVATPKAKVSYIKVCSTQTNIAQWQLAICGYSFDSKHKALLLIYTLGKGAFWIRNIPVDMYGNFHVAWNITDCRNIPIYIYGYEATSSTPIRVSLHIKSFGACIASPTPVVKPSMLSPKIGI